MKKTTPLFMGAASLLALATAAHGQATLEEVIVTAQKREQSLQDVPIAITAFTQWNCSTSVAPASQPG